MLVTDLAPVDLVLQRLGRIHRHPRERPAHVRAAECVLVGVEDWDATPVRSVVGSRRVYGEHTLLRSAALLVDRDSLELPTDISPLVQQAYGEEPVGPAEWQDVMRDAERAHTSRSIERAARARTFRLDAVPNTATTLVGWVHAGVGDADEDPAGIAQVRDGAETLEVLVVCRDDEGGLTTAPWIPSSAGVALSHDFAPDPEVARAVAASALRFPLALSHEGVIDDVTAELERTFVPGFQQSPLLKGRLLLVLEPDRRTRLRAGEHTYALRYDLHRGLLHERV